MSLPVICITAGVLDRVPAVDHHPVPDIDPDMGSAGGIIGPLEEDQVSRFGLAGV